MMKIVQGSESMMRVMSNRNDRLSCESSFLGGCESRSGVGRTDDSEHSERQVSHSHKSSVAPTTSTSSMRTVPWL